MAIALPAGAAYGPDRLRHQPAEPGGAGLQLADGRRHARVRQAARPAGRRRRPRLAGRRRQGRRRSRACWAGPWRRAAAPAAGRRAAALGIDINKAITACVARAAGDQAQIHACLAIANGGQRAGGPGASIAGDRRRLPPPRRAALRPGAGLSAAYHGARRRLGPAASGQRRPGLAVLMCHFLGGGPARSRCPALRASAGRAGQSAAAERRRCAALSLKQDPQGRRVWQRNFLRPPPVDGVRRADADDDPGRRPGPPRRRRGGHGSAPPLAFLAREGASQADLKAPISRRSRKHLPNHIFRCGLRACMPRGMVRRPPTMRGSAPDAHGGFQRPAPGHGGPRVDAG